MAVLLEAPYSQFLDNTGVPLAGGLVYTYAAGTTSNKATYTNSSGDTPAANPIVLDSAGRATIWIDGSYKITVTSADGSFTKTTDNITSFINNTTGGTTLTNTTLVNPIITGGTINNTPIGATTPNTIAATTISATQGISLGNIANASATVLDWYQEGTFTPVLAGTTTPGTGTYVSQVGQYQRVGNRVQYSILLNWSAHTGTGSAIITGLPFVNAGSQAPGTINNFGYVTAASSFLVGQIEAAASSLTLYQTVASTGASSAAAIKTSAILFISGGYFV